VTTAQAGRPDTIMGRALSVRAVALTALGPQLAGGELDLTTAETPPIPAPVRAAAEAALDRGETHYTTRPGVTALREAIARQMTDEGFPATADAMLITNGGSEALYIALQTLLEPGQRIIVAGPAAPNVIEMIRFVGAEPVALPPVLAGGFIPSVDALAPAEAAAILIASPSPVTGLAVPSGELEALIAAATRHDMTVFLDRSLTTALYDPAQARFGHPELAAKIVTIGSFSAGHGLTGWRVGWLTAPTERMKRPRELKQAMSICTTAVSQYAAMAMLDDPEGWLASRRQAFARRRDDVMAALHSTRLAPLEPDAYPTLLIDIRALADDDVRFAANLRKATDVVVQPGSAFGPSTRGYVRLDLGAPEATLREGIARLAAFATRESQP
jgi:aspartate aminotransferase